MGSTSKSAPDVPDLNTTIAGQVGGNVGTTKLNDRFTDTYTPYGSTTIEKQVDPVTGKTIKTKYVDPTTGEVYKLPEYEEHVTLSPEQQQIYDLSTQAQTTALGGYNEILSSLGATELDPYDWNKSLADYGGSVYDPTTNPLDLSVGETEKRLYELGSSFLDPRFAQEDASLQAELAAKGLRPGTEAYDRALSGQADEETRAYNDLLLAGHETATGDIQAEADWLRTGQAQQFGQAKDVADWELAQRGQYSKEALDTQAMNLSTAGLLGAAGGTATVPELTGQETGEVPYTDYAGLTNTNWDQQFKAWEQEMANKSGMAGGLFDMAGSLGAAAISDERLKDNVKQVGTTKDGLPIYEFSIGGGPMQTGVMAQDVEAANPDAVVEGPGGIKGVDYPAAVGDGTGTYVVKRGDNISSIGQRLGVDPREIIAANPDLDNPDLIYPGQELVVPGMAAPGPAAIPLAVAGIPAVTAALAGPAGPGTAPPGAMPAAPAIDPRTMAAAAPAASVWAGKFSRPAPVPVPPRSAEAYQSSLDQAADQGVAVPPRQLIDRDAMLQMLMSNGGMGAY